MEETPPRKVSRFRRLFFKIAWPLTVLGTIIALAYAIILWRGEARWERIQERIRAAGESLDVKSDRKTAVPDDQNFGATRSLKGLNFVANLEKASLDVQENVLKMKRLEEWRKSKTRPQLHRDAKQAKRRQTDPAPAAAASDPLDAARAVLQGWDRFQPLWSELETAAHRPEAFLTPVVGSPVSDPPPAYEGWIAIQYLSFAMSDIACACAELGLWERAEASLRVSFQLLRAAKEEFSRIPGLAAFCLVRFQRAFAVGLARHAWTETQLAGWQRDLEKISCEKMAVAAVRREGARALEDWESIYDNPRLMEDMKRYRRVFPRGWIVQNQALYYERWLDLIITPLKGAGLSGALRQRGEISQATACPHCFPSPLWNGRIRMGFERYDDIITNGAHAEMQRRLTIVACAMERSRIKSGAYPANLDALVPDYLPSVPLDYDGKPVRVSNQQGQFALWSVGLNPEPDWSSRKYEGRETGPWTEHNTPDWLLVIPKE